MHFISQDRFKEILSSLKFYTEYNHAMAAERSLWHSRVMLRHVMRHSAPVPFPKESITLPPCLDFHLMQLYTLLQYIANSLFFSIYDSGLSTKFELALS
jgi:hypothetical protein